MMDCGEVRFQITQWLKEYPGFVIGISGGVDSSVVSTLCTITGKPTILVSIPIHQPVSHLQRAHEHMEWLMSKYTNVQTYEVDLTETYEVFKKTLPKEASLDLALVNARSRLRMTTLYNFANSFGYIVAGTGNMVEDYGVTFFTKYGDGGVDISPIGDLLKTEVWALAKRLGICKSIIDAKPTDGLWEDDRSDEDQIGATYPELEWAMNYYDNYHFNSNTILTERQKVVYNIYKKRHENGKHKLEMPPICKIKWSNVYY